MVPIIAVVTTLNNEVSNTFIKAHINGLNAHVYSFHGLPMPVHIEGLPMRKKNQLSRFFKLLPAVLYNKILNREDDKFYIRKKFKQLNIQAVLAEYGHTACKLLPICKELNLPLLVHFHGYDAYRNSILDVYRNEYKDMFAYASAIISVSNHMTQQLISLGASPKKIYFNPYGPNTCFFNVTPALTDNIYLSLGRFVEKKAPFLTILAFAKLQENHPNVKLVMIGDGPLLGTCKQMAFSLGLKNVLFTGALSHDAVIKYFEIACCFLQHSLIASDGDSEGTPVAILEAGAAGLPVISTRHAGILDAVKEGETGFLVDEGDYESMAHKMEILYKNIELRKSMGFAAREHIKKNYSLQRHLDTINEIITSSVNNKN